MVSDSVSGIPPLHPQELVRVTEKNGKRFFGYQHTQRDELIRRRLIPAPFEPYPGAKFSFWTGQQILDASCGTHRCAQAALSENKRLPHLVAVQACGFRRGGFRTVNPELLPPNFLKGGAAQGARSQLGRLSMPIIDAQSDNRPVPTGQVEQHSILVQQAFTAIDAAASVEEVKKVLDQWAGLAAYARAAKEKQLEADAAIATRGQLGRSGIIVERQGN